MNKKVEDLKHIRSMMERSSKFLTISGMAGVGAGVSALVGAYLVHLILSAQLGVTGYQVVDIIIIALLVLLGAAFCGLFFSMRKARKSGSKFWMPATYNILKDFAVPMGAGGLFCMLLIMHQTSYLIPAAMLIFYGVALIAAAARTYNDVKILGACEIFLGLLAGVFVRYSIFIWALGFGLLHIAYGIVIYLKHDSANKD